MKNIESSLKSNNFCTIWKTIISLMFGGLALAFSKTAIPLDNLYGTKFVWSLIFPMIISYAWETKYAFISAIGGLTFLVPFYVYSTRGYGNIILAVYETVVFISSGYYLKTHEDYEGKKGYILMIISGICFSIINFYLYPHIVLFNNSSDGFVRYLPSSILLIQTLNSVFLFVMFGAICSVLLNLSSIRKFFLLEPLPYDDNSLRYLMMTLISIIAFYIIDVNIDSLYTSITGVHMSFFVAYTGGNIKVIIVTATAFFICNYVMLNSREALEAKNKIVRSKEKYQMIYENLIDVYFEILEDGTILNASPSVCCALGYAKNYVEGHNIADFVYFTEDANKMLNKLKEKGSLTNLEILGRKSNGKKVYLLLEGRTKFDKLDQSKSIILIARNITNYVLSEQQRIDLTANLNALFESYDDFVWIIKGNDYSILSYNKNFYDYVYDLMGVKLKKGITVNDIVKPELVSVWNGFLNRVLKNGRFRIEYNMDGNGRTFEISFFPIILYNSDINIAIVSREITEKIKIEEQMKRWNMELETRVDDRTRELQRAYKDLESFSHTVSHELKTPIREIEAYIECIEEDNKHLIGGQTQKDINDIKKICEDTINLVQDMMYYSKAGYMVLENKEINLETLVKESFESLSLAYENKDAILDLYELPRINGDYFLIKQAIFNILSNCFKYSSKRSNIKITVGCMISPTKYTFYFNDNGVGFDYSLSGKLFQLFERVHNQSQYEGNGIGLATVKKIVERHGGTVSIMGYYNKGCTVFLDMKK